MRRTRRPRAPSNISLRRSDVAAGEPVSPIRGPPPAREPSLSLRLPRWLPGLPIRGLVWRSVDPWRLARGLRRQPADHHTRPTTCYLLGAVRSDRDLALVDLRAPAVIGLFEGIPKLDARLGDGDDYRLSQAWAARIHDCAPQAHGLLYRGRKAGENCVALFGDRIGGSLVPAEVPADIDDPRWAADRASFTGLSGIKWGTR